MKHLRIFMASLVIFFGVGALAPVAFAAPDTPQSTVCQTLGSNDSCTSNPHGSVGVNSLIKLTVNILSIVVGVASVIMVIVGGFRYITSGGDSNNISSAKNTILYAIIGLVVVAMAQFLVQFVLSKVK